MSNKTDVQDVQDNQPTSDVPELPPVQDSLPTKAEAPKTDIDLTSAESFNFIVADESVVKREGATVSGLMALAATKQYGTDNSYKLAAKEFIHFRRMFRAPERIRNLIGNPDAPDLYGASTEYRDALREVNKQARKDLIDAILAETPDLSQKAAEGEATDLLKRFDQNMKREVRIMLDREFRSLGNEGARIMLCYGFRHTSAIKSTQTIPENWKIDEKTGKLEIPAAKPILVQGDTDQVKQSETANKENQAIKDELAAKGEDITNPLTLVNQAIVLLRDASAMMEQKGFEFPKGTTLKIRQQTRANLHTAARTVSNALVPPVPAKELEAAK